MTTLQTSTPPLTPDAHEWGTQKWLRLSTSWFPDFLGPDIHISFWLQSPFCLHSSVGAPSFWDRSMIRNTLGSSLVLPLWQNCLYFWSPGSTNLDLGTEGVGLGCLYPEWFLAPVCPGRDSKKISCSAWLSEKQTTIKRTWKEIFVPQSPCSVNLQIKVNEPQKAAHCWGKWCSWSLWSPQTGVPILTLHW